MKDKVLIIDAHNQMRRANISFDFKKKEVVEEAKEEQTENFTMVYNFFRSFRAIFEQFDPNLICFVLEGHPQFRYDLYPEYKANRIIKTGDEKKRIDNENFHRQKRIVIDLLKLLPVRQYKAKNYECDDVIAYICRDLPNDDVTIISNDSDFTQLLQEGLKCKIYNPIKKEYMVAPEYHYVAHKALVGDKTDNIEGLLSKAKALKIISDPKAFEAFINDDKNKEKFNRNLSLIKIPQINEDELEFFDGQKDFDALKQRFNEMKFDSITNDKSWSRFVDTFKDIP